MPVSAVEVTPPAAVRSRVRRIDALDWTKGGLIIFMVAYHAINYSAFRPLAFQYLAFLPPSFILITGFLVGQVYATKYDLRSWQAYLRLGSRGAKLLVLFVVLNVGHCIALQRSISDGLWEFADRSSAIFLSGNGREGIFEVLLPIAYFLLLAPALLWLRIRFRPAVVLGALAVFGITLALELSGQSSKNLTLLSAGFIGVGFGLVPIGKLDRVARLWPGSLLIYGLYRACSYHWGESYLIQMWGVVISVFLLYSCALCLDLQSRLAREVTALGKYSLLGYLGQILLLQLLVRVWGEQPTRWYGVLALGLATAVLLLLLIKAVDNLRGRSRAVDMCYRALFS